MKMLFFLFLLASVGVAGEKITYAEPPAWLKGAVYTVTLKTGKVFTSTSETMKLVPRVNHGAKVQVKVVPAVIERVVEKLVEKPVFSRYDFSLYAGHGPLGTASLKEGQSDARVENDFGPIAGIGVGYNFDSVWGMEAIAQSNRTFLLGVKYGAGIDSE